MLQIRFMSRQRSEVRGAGCFSVNYLTVVLTNSLAGGALSAVHEGVEVVCSLTDRVPVLGTAAVPPLVAPVALTEAPLTVSCEGTATKALVVVVIVVVVM